MSSEELELHKAKASIDAEYDRWRLELERETQMRIAMSSAIIGFALAALKAVILLNGGSAVAVLAFLGHIWDADGHTARAAAAAIRPAMLAFVVGAFCGCAATAVSYVSQLLFGLLPSGRKIWIGGGFQILAILLATVGLGAFGLGALWTIEALAAAPDSWGRDGSDAPRMGMAESGRSDSRYRRVCSNRAGTGQVT